MSPAIGWGWCAAAFLGSWQSMRTRISPGWKCVPERMDCTASPCSSRAWKNTSLQPGLRSGHCHPTREALYPAQLDPC